VKEILGSSKRTGRIYGKAYFALDPIANAERGGTKYIGEAGGFQDAIAGFGFRYAVLTASLAADSILNGTSYTALLQKTFGDEFAAAAAVRAKLNAFTNDDFDRLVQSMGPSMTVEEYRQHRASRLL
jgi:flavin-dependent dehydrogenase